MPQAPMRTVLLFAVLVVAGCRAEPGRPSAAERAMDEIQSRYDDLAGGRTGEAVDWAQDDFENIGDWEYRILEMPQTASEPLENELNVLGNERWEVYWVETSARGVRFYLKRPAISYLSRVPLATLVRMLAGGAQ